MPRLILFAWLSNLLLAMIVAAPLFFLLDAYVGGTVQEDTLMQRMDQNWWLTFKADHPGDPVVGLLDYSIMGAAPFLAHLDNVLHGGVAAPLAGFAYDLVVTWTFSWSGLNLLVLVGLLSLFLNALLSVAFVATYQGDYPPTVAEFLSVGARYVGPSLRLSLLVLLLQAAVLYPVLNGLASWIAAGTQNQPSEMTPFLYYMGRNVLAFFLFFFLVLAADYARVRLVIERRRSAIGSLMAGFGFVFSRLRVTSGVGAVFVFGTLVLILLYAAFEYALPTTTGLLVFVLFLLQQIYMVLRQAIRATTYACEVDVFQTSGIRS